MTMQEIDMKPINPHTISKLSSLSLKKIDQTLISLLDKHMIQRRYGQLDLKPLYQLLLNEKVKEDKELNLIEVFENVFGRSLNVLELEAINSYKSAGYDDQMIIDALNEAVKSGTLNLRYIEKILDNWAKNGVKRRFAPMKQTVPDVDKAVKDYKWWENNE